jgi:hypothetical protein
VGVARKQFFFEKKNQKTFDCCPKPRVPPETDKRFLVLFFKKRTASLSLTIRVSVQTSLV